MQFTQWCFTSYATLIKTIDDPRVRYMVYQREKCPETGKLHWQGYIEFHRSVKMGGVKNVIGDRTAHLEARAKNSTRAAARAYCMKEDSRVKGTRPIEYGEWDPDSEPGQRTDLIEARKLICSKRKLDECYTDPALDSITTKYPKWVEKVHSLRPRDEMSFDIELFEWERQVLVLLYQGVQHRRIIWIVAPPKTGKTTFLSYLSTKWDVLPAGSKMWDVLSAYDDNEIIWFNVAKANSGRIEGGFYAMLEELSDIGWKLSTKGWPVIKKFIKAHIVVTSNTSPDEDMIPDRCVVINATPEINI